ncbi:MAG: peroxide stress protein YaaA [Bacteroidales bacterium]|nr:peroxide stress protein YaaA [Bacteroidales bacterium]
MKIILSPAKRLNEKKTNHSFQISEPLFLKQSEELINILKKKSKSEISELMNLSDTLTELNFNRYQNWNKNKCVKEGKASIFMFEGDAYRGLDIKSMSQDEVLNLNEKLIILSGLYGLLKPLDAILPYRLEMGTSLENDKGKNLYEFWKSILTEKLNHILSNEPLINLASKEYSSVIDFNKIKSEVIQIDFLQELNGQYKNIAIHSKRARGLMTAYVIKNNINIVDDLKGFNSEKYYFNNEMSKKNHLVFSR